MRRVLALMLLLVALVTAGCGGDDGGGKATSKDDYGRQLAQTGQSLQKTFSGIADETGSKTSAKQIGDRLDQAAAALDATAKKFEAITPPSDVKDAHAKLVAGLRELADVCRKGADAARKNDSTSLAQALKDLSAGDGLKKINEAEAELKKAGVTVTTATG